MMNFTMNDVISEIMENKKKIAKIFAVRDKKSYQEYMAAIRNAVIGAAAAKKLRVTEDDTYRATYRIDRMLHMVP